LKFWFPSVTPKHTELYTSEVFINYL
jgi:hypothetical protein